jgi:ribosome-associated protein
MGSYPNTATLQNLNQIAQIIFDKKGFNILGLDVRAISSLTDYVIIAEGMADKHVIAIGEAIIETLSKEGSKPLYVEGLSTGDWVVIDYLDIVVHLFMPGIRDKYHLEELWRDSELVDLDIRTSPQAETSQERRHMG